MMPDVLTMLNHSKRKEKFETNIEELHEDQKDDNLDVA
jgi:hypothetical protein